MLAKLDSEFSQASSSTELALGSLPQKQVRATEAIQLAEQSAASFTVLGARLERDVLQPLLEMCLDTIVENAHLLDKDELIDLVGSEKALKLRSTAQHAPAVLKKAFACTKISVSGLSSMGERTRDFYRYQQFLQILATTVLPLAQVLPVIGLDTEKLIEQVTKTLGLDIEKLKLPASQRQAPPPMPAEGPPTGAPGIQAQQIDSRTPGNMPTAMGA